MEKEEWIQKVLEDPEKKKLPYAAIAAGVAYDLTTMTPEEWLATESECINGAVVWWDNPKHSNHNLYLKNKEIKQLKEVLEKEEKSLMALLKDFKESYGSE